jgi:hypothetical protein
MEKEKEREPRGDKRMKADFTKRARRALEDYEKLTRQRQAEAGKSKRFLRSEAEE